MTIREQILVAFGTALNTGRPGTVPEFVRSRYHRLSKAGLPANTWFPLRDQRESIGGRNGVLVKRKLGVIVELVAKAATGVTPDAAVDVSAAWVTDAVVRNRLGTLANSIDEVESTYRFMLEGETPICRLRVELVIEYQTRADNAEQVA